MEYIIFKEFNNYCMTSKQNYYAQIQNANSITKFDKSNGFSDITSVLNYVKKYFNIDIAKIQIIE